MRRHNQHKRLTTHTKIILPYVLFGMLAALLGVVVTYALLLAPMNRAFTARIAAITDELQDDLNVTARAQQRAVLAATVAFAVAPEDTETNAVIAEHMLDDPTIDTAFIVGEEGVVYAAEGRLLATALNSLDLFASDRLNRTTTRFIALDGKLWLATSMVHDTDGDDDATIVAMTDLDALLQGYATGNAVDVVLANDAWGVYSAENGLSADAAPLTNALQRAYHNADYIDTDLSNTFVYAGHDQDAIISGNNLLGLVMPFQETVLWQTRLLSLLIAVAFIGLGALIANALGKRVAIPVSALIAAGQTLVDQWRDPDQDAPLADDDLPRLTHELQRFSADALQRRRLESLLYRYLGTTVPNKVLLGDEGLFESQYVTATVLFADIRDFTALLEIADLADLHSELNEYYRMIIRVIRNNAGEVNKFGGDSVLALFGATTTLVEHAQAAVVAANQIMEELKMLNEQRLEQGRPPFRVGIGVNTGEMLVGNFGSEQRLEYTVIGDCVNTAQRLSDLSKETPFYSVFLGERTRRSLTVSPDWDIDLLGEITLRGRREPITTYALTPLDAL
jgi:class 3 adenylate cyclase